MDDEDDSGAWAHQQELEEQFYLQEHEDGKV